MKISSLLASVLIHVVFATTLIVVSALRQPAPKEFETEEILFVEILDSPLPVDSPDSLDSLDSPLPVDSPDSLDSLDSPLPVDSPLETSRVVSLPAAVNTITPKYPRSARRKGHEGRVLVEAEIGVSGEVLRVEVVDSSGHPELDSAAVDAVRHAEFISAKDGDTPVLGVIRLPIEFRLKHSGR